MNEASATVPLARNEIKLTPAQEANFWAKINKDGPTQPHMESPCWIWMASGDRKGYGQMRVGIKLLQAHRIAWVIKNGENTNLCVCHRCDNPACVNPSHLFLGSHKENMRDMAAKKRDGSHTKPEKLCRGEDHGCTTLTSDQVIAIRSPSSERFSQRQLAKQFNVSQSTIGNILRRYVWRHL
jgi:hypothetical protein